MFCWPQVRFSKHGWLIDFRTPVNQTQFLTFEPKHSNEADDEEKTFLNFFYQKDFFVDNSKINFKLKGKLAKN